MIPGLRLSLAMTASKAAEDAMQLQTNSSRIASHLNAHRNVKFIKQLTSNHLDFYSSNCGQSRGISSNREPVSSVHRRNNQEFTFCTKAAFSILNLQYDDYYYASQYTFCEIHHMS